MSIQVRAYTERSIAGCGLFLDVDEKAGMHGGGLFCQDFAGQDCRLVLEPGAFGEPWAIRKCVTAPSQAFDAFPKALGTTERIGALTIDLGPVAQANGANSGPINNAGEPLPAGAIVVRMSVDRYKLGFVPNGPTVSPPIPARFDLELVFVRLA